MEVKLCDFSQSYDIQQLVALQNVVYAKRGLTFSDKLFRFWYLENPMGKVLSYNAYDNGNLIAHQAFVPEIMMVGDRTVRCLRSMAVVTHPDYRKKGLFATLTNNAVVEAQKRGFEFIYAIANAYSTPVFVKYCNFSYITSLDVKVGCGLNIKPQENRVYRRVWDEDTLKWRLSYSTNYQCVRGCIVGRYKYGIPTFMAVLDANLLDQICMPTHAMSLPCCLYVGIGADLPWSYCRVPSFVKHSPFNLVFCDLTNGNLPKMTADNVFYQLLDFDVV